MARNWVPQSLEGEYLLKIDISICGPPGLEKIVPYPARPQPGATPQRLTSVSPRKTLAKCCGFRENLNRKTTSSKR